MMLEKDIQKIKQTIKDYEEELGKGNNISINNYTHTIEISNKEFSDILFKKFNNSTKLITFVQNHITEKYRDFNIGKFKKLDRNEQVNELVDYTEGDPGKRKYIIDCIK